MIIESVIRDLRQEHDEREAWLADMDAKQKRAKQIAANYGKDY